jgi:Flp pilus assembly protein CpaB
MAVIASPARGHWTRVFNRSVVAGLLCGLLMLGLIARLAALWWEPKLPMLVTAADLPVGTILQEAHLETTEVVLDAAVAGGYLRRSELTSALGQPLREAVHRGAMLRREAVSGPPPFAGDQERVSVPVRAEYAVGGALKPGDVVRVVQVRGDRAETVLERAPLVAVQPGLVVTFVLPAAEADRLLVARQRGELQLLLVPSLGGSP